MPEYKGRGMRFGNSKYHKEVSQLEYPNSSEADSTVVEACRVMMVESRAMLCHCLGRSVRLTQ